MSRFQSFATGMLVGSMVANDMITIVAAYSGVKVKKGIPAVCGILFETKGNVVYRFIEMENVKGLCTLLNTEILKWKDSKDGYEDIDLCFHTHERNQNAFKVLTKIVKTVNGVPFGTPTNIRNNLLKYYIRNKNYGKQKAYDEMIALANVILDYNEALPAGKLNITITEMPGVDKMRAIQGAVTQHWEDLQEAKKLPANVIPFRQPKS